MELYLFFFSRNILGVGCGRDMMFGEWPTI